MPITESDWKAAQRETIFQDKTRAMTQRLIEQAEVDAALLTGHPEWDRYMQRVQTLINEAIQARDTWQDAYNRAFTEAQRNQAQVEYHCNRVLVDRLQHILTFPKEILAHAAQHRAEGSSH